MTFIPSKNGFHFANLFERDTYFPFIGDTSNGMCGGMVFAALDCWHQNKEIPDLTEPPKPGTPLFNYIKKRQMDSVVSSVAKCYTWTALFDDLFVRSLRSISGVKMPVPLTLIMTKSWNPMDLAYNHQVIACDRTDKEISIYDPNYPDDDMKVINIDDGFYYDGEKLRGFYVTRY